MDKTVKNSIKRIIIFLLPLGYLTSLIWPGFFQLLLSIFFYIAAIVYMNSIINNSRLNAGKLMLLCLYIIFFTGFSYLITEYTYSPLGPGAMILLYLIATHAAVGFSMILINSSRPYVGISVFIGFGLIVMF